MKQFTLTLLTKEPKETHQIEAEDILELLMKFQFVVANAVRKTEEKKCDDRIATVVARLDLYTRHLDHCQMTQPSLLMAGDGPNSCTCGLAELRPGGRGLDYV